MDRDKEQELDQLMQRTAMSIEKSLDATVDVEQHLRDLLREAGIDPALVQAPRRRP